MLAKGEAHAGPRYTPHHSTCPQGGSWRGTTRAERAAPAASAPPPSSSSSPPAAPAVEAAPVAAVGIQVRTIGDDVVFRIAPAASAIDNDTPEWFAHLCTVPVAVLNSDPDKAEDGRGRLFWDLNKALMDYFARVALDATGVQLGGRFHVFEPSKGRSS
jgi:hypothetical protein